MTLTIPSTQSQSQSQIQSRPTLGQGLTPPLTTSTQVSCPFEVYRSVTVVKDLRPSPDPSVANSVEKFDGMARCMALLCNSYSMHSFLRELLCLWHRK